MSSQVLHLLFLFTIAYLVSFDLVFAQAPSTIDLPCTSATLGSNICMGSLGNVSALPGSDCMSNQNCEVILIGQHITSNDTIQWQLMTSLVSDKGLTVQFYVLRNQFTGFSFPTPLPKEFENVPRVKEFCLQGDVCLFCSEYIDKPGACSTNGSDYKGHHTDADVVNLNGWKSNPFRRVSFESKTIIEALPYRAEFFKDKLWPYLDVSVNFIKQSHAGFLSPTQMFCHGDTCQSSTTGSDAEITGTSSDGNAGGSKDPKTTRPPEAGKPKTGLIIGSIIGLLVVLVAIGALIWYLAKKKPAPNKPTPNEPTPNEPTPDEQTPNEADTRSLLGNSPA